MYANHVAIYHETNVETQSQQRLIVLLYEGAIRFAEHAAQAIAQGDIPQRGMMINRASRIVHELRNALDHEVGGELAERLAALYDFVDRQLALANVGNDAKPLRAAIEVLSTLLAGWRKAIDCLEQAPPPLPAAAPASIAEHAGLSLRA
jgi:flagellar protein FliS